MRKMLLATATAVSMAAIPAAAQEYTDDGTTMQSMAHLQELNEQQRAERQNWTVELRDYYDGLDRDYRTTWWFLDDMQRSMLYTMSETDRQRQWDMYRTQFAGMEMERTVNNVKYVRKPVVQQAPIPRYDHDFTYPVCEDDADRHCINPEALSANEIERRDDIVRAETAVTAAQAVSRAAFRAAGMQNLQSNLKASADGENAIKSDKIAVDLKSDDNVHYGMKKMV